MSQPSSWPLAAESYRFVIPQQFVQILAFHPLSKALYPLGMGYYKRAQTHQMQRKNPEDHLLIYCVEGKGEIALNGRDHIVSAGDLMCLPKHVSHQYQAAFYHPWTIYWLHFDGEQGQAFIDYLGFSVEEPVLSIGHQTRLIRNFERLFEIRNASHQQSAYIHAANRLRQQLAEIPMLPQQTHQISRSGNFDLAQIHATMQAHLHGDLNLEMLAKQTRLSKYHFVKKYKQSTGTTPINHFIHLKVQHACYLLDISDKSIRDISESVGYEDSYYFSRLFKKIMGCSPSHYRRSQNQ